VVQVHAATTERSPHTTKTLWPSGVPGWGQALAEQLLRRESPSTRRILGAGEGGRIKYHLLYWDGKQWSMLGQCGGYSSDVARKTWRAGRTSRRT